MRNLILILFMLTQLIPYLEGQHKGNLYLNENRLEGKCEDPYFSGFMIELDTIYEEIDSLKLFNQLPRIGILNVKNSFKTPTEFTLTNRAGYAQVMFRFKSEWHTFDNLIFEKKTIKYIIDRDPVIPATENDVRIIQLAKKILSEKKYWNKNDDRNCEDDLANKCFSLYCVLKIASIEIENRYNHRNAVLQKLRHLIEERHPNRKWNHRLMDFNNLDETSFEVVFEILEEIEANFIEELASK